MSEEANEIRDLQKRITQLHGVFLFIITSVLVVMMFANVVLLWVFPSIEKMFEDMLGSRNKLPVLTLCVLGYRHLLGGLVAFTSVITVPLLTIFFLFFFRRSITTAVIAGVVALLLILHLILVFLSVFMPLVGIISGLNAN